MKKFYFLIMALCCISVYGQELNSSKMQIENWGSHFRKIGAGNTIPYYSMNVEPIGLMNNRIYFTLGMKRTDKLDSLYCYDIDKQEIVASKKNNTGNCYFFSRSGLKNIHCKTDGDIIRYTLSSINPNTLEEEDTHEIMGLERDKKADFDWYSSMSPDSSKLAVLVGVNEGKSARRDWWIITYDNIEDTYTKRTVSLKISQNYYTISSFDILDNGNILVVTESHDDEYLYKSKNIDFNINIIQENEGDDNEMTVIHQDMNMEMLNLKTRCLHDGRIMVGLTQRHKKNKTDYELHYKLIDGKNIENSSELMKYEFPDIWLENQKVSLAKYDNMTIDNILETDNGDIYFTGFPCKIALGNGIRKSSWGGIYCLQMDKDGTVEKLNYIERMTKGTRSTGYHTLTGMNMYYDCIKYGNKVYITFNENVDKIEKNDIKASYRQMDKENYVEAYEIGSEEMKKYSLTGDKRSELALNTYLGKIDNRFYYTARNQDYGTIVSVDFEKVKEIDHTKKKVKKTAVQANKNEKTSKTSASSASNKKSTTRKRTVKK